MQQYFKSNSKPNSYLYLTNKQTNKQSKEPTYLPVKIPYGHAENNFDIFFMELGFHLGQCRLPPFCTTVILFRSLLLLFLK